jgi:hypothetical protein
MGVNRRRRGYANLIFQNPAHRSWDSRGNAEMIPIRKFVESSICIAARITSDRLIRYLFEALFFDVHSPSQAGFSEAL